jgi:hypothetical protein
VSSKNPAAFFFDYGFVLPSSVSYHKNVSRSTFRAVVNFLQDGFGFLALQTPEKNNVPLPRPLVSLAYSFETSSSVPIVYENLE